MSGTWSVVPPRPGGVPQNIPSSRNRTSQRGPSENLQRLLDSQAEDALAGGPNQRQQQAQAEQPQVPGMAAAQAAAPGGGFSAEALMNDFLMAQADAQNGQGGDLFSYQSEMAFQNQQDRFGAQSQLYGVRPDMAQWLQVRIDPERSGLGGGSNWQQDRYARQRGFPSVTHPYGRAANHFWSMEGDRLAQTQAALVRAGFLRGDHVAALGRHDPAGRDHAAWLDALSMAARLNKEVFAMLDEAGESGAWDDQLGLVGGGGGAGGTAPRRPDVQLMSAADAAKLADAVGQELIGRKLSEEERAKVISAIHGTQTSEQNAAIDVAMNEAGGGTAMQPTQPQTVAENQVRQDLNTEVKGAEALGAFNQLMQMIGGGR